MTSASCTSVLYQATLGSNHLRFTAPPQGASSTTPWIVLEDLLTLLKLNKSQRQTMLRNCQNGPFSSQFRTVALAGGLATLCSAVSSREIFHSLRDAGMGNQAKEDFFHRASVRAMKTYLAPLPPEERVSRILKAFTEQDDLEPSP